MIPLFRDIFDYHHKVNQELIAEFTKFGASLPDRTFPLFCHILNAHQIWNSRILNTEPFGLNQQHPVEACPDLDTRNLESTISILETVDPQKVISYTNSKGNAYANNIRDILFHIANHTTHHRGQIISDFRQSGIPPIVTDYIFFKRSR